jgi:glucosamine-6-phosphate deaminase
MTRHDEVRALLRLSPAEVQDRAGGRLIVCSDLDALHQHFAESIATEISANNAAGRPTRLILPVGPTGQYPILAELINTRELSLRRCSFFMMDEHCDDDGQALSPDHPLSFRRALDELFVSRVASRFAIPAEQLVFPDQLNVGTLAEQIAAGGIDTTYGGIGIHGHLAYNEPEAGVSASDPRIVSLNEFTRTMNAIRAGIGGNLEGYPRRGITLGMRQLLSAKRIRLYCRNGLSLDWANTVLRLALFGRPGDDYPVTWIRNHPDCVIVTDADTLRSPQFVV